MRTRSEKTVYPVDGLTRKGVFFETPERAVKTLAKMVDYQRFRLRNEA